MKHNTELRDKVINTIKKFVANKLPTDDLYNDITHYMRGNRKHIYSEDIQEECETARDNLATSWINFLDKNLEPKERLEVIDSLVASIALNSAQIWHYLRILDGNIGAADVENIRDFIWNK